MRDYSLIRYLAKMTGAEPKKDKNYLNCFFPYDEDGVLIASFYFNRGQSKIAMFDLSDVYEKYGKEKFRNYEEFFDAFLEQAEIFEKSTDDNGNLYAKSDLTVNRLDNVASQALMNSSIVCISLNKLLGKKAKVYRENDWRSFHRMYLKKQKLICGGISAASLIAAILSAVAAFTLDISNNGLFLVLAAPLLLVSLFFFPKYVFYRHNLKRAKKEKNYT